MSEFTCGLGHDMSPRDIFCPQCGGRVARMDGHSNAELRRMEEYERREEEEEDECSGSEEGS
jgi:hypothetical protein